MLDGRDREVQVALVGVLRHGEVATVVLFCVDKLRFDVAGSHSVAELTGRDHSVLYSNQYPSSAAG